MQTQNALDELSQVIVRYGYPVGINCCKEHAERAGVPVTVPKYFKRKGLYQNLKPIPKPSLEEAKRTFEVLKLREKVGEAFANRIDALIMRVLQEDFSPVVLSRPAPTPSPPNFS